MKTQNSNPLLARLRHHVTGAIERGEATAIAGIPAHTPTPWATDILIAADLIAREGANSGRKNDHRIDSASIYVDHGSGKGGEICTFRHDPEDGLSLLDSEQQANAAHIVKCVNSHAELVSALRGTMRTMEMMHGKDCRCSECQSARSILSRL